MEVPFKVQHRIHHVLQNLWPGDRATFGHVTHHEDGNTIGLGDLHEFPGHRPNL